MKGNKICKVLLLFVMIIIAFAIYSVCYAESEKITENLEISASVHDENGNRKYGIWIENEKNIMIYVKASDYGLPSNLYEYKDDILLRITYSEGDEYKVYDCKVISKRTNDIIEDLSEENLNKLFNIEYKKEIIEKEWTSDVYLSELEENVIYQYTTTRENMNTIISFVNNTGKNCFIYIKTPSFTKNTYTRYTNVIKNIPYRETKSVNILSDSISGYTVNIMYRIIDDKELINSIDKEYINYLSKYKAGEQIELKLTASMYKNNFIYNDTEKDITLNIKYSENTSEQSKVTVIEKGEIYEVDDFQIEAISIANTNSAGDNSADEKTEEKIDNDNKQNSNDDKNNNKENKDNTIIPDSKLPKTGTSNIVIILILSFITGMSVIIIKLRNLKDIK